jgi:hypothetical protein
MYSILNDFLTGPEGLDKKTFRIKMLSEGKRNRMSRRNHMEYSDCDMKDRLLTSTSANAAYDFVI